MKRYPLYVLVGLLLLTGCVKRPKGVLSDKEMAPVVADLELAEAYLQMNRGGSPDRKDRLVQYVLDKHGVSRADFDTTMAWYGRNVDDYQKLYKNVDKILNERHKKLAEATPRESNLDENDIWNYSRHVMISSKGATNAMSFSIPAAQVAKGEQLLFRFRMRTMADASMLFGVEYENGELTYVNKTVRPATKNELTLQTDTLLKVKRVFGNVYVPNKADLPVWMDSIAIVRLPFDSLEYYNIYGQRSLSKMGNIMDK